VGPYPYPAPASVALTGWSRGGGGLQWSDRAVVSQDATDPVHPNSRTMQNTAGPALVCEDGNVSRGWRVCCYMSCTSILTWGSGSCRLDTPAAPTGDPSHARGAVTGCRLPASFSRYTLCQSSTSILASNKSFTHVRRCLRPWPGDTPGYTSPSTRLCCAGKTCQRLHRRSLVTRWICAGGMLRYRPRRAQR
jgi:hypothetical protein